MTETLADALRRGVAALRPIVGGGAARDARAILAWAAEVDPMQIALSRDHSLGAAARARFDAGLADRARHRPVAQIIGQRMFWGRTFRVTADVLDPRPETETIIACALEHQASSVLDLGTGSGVLLLTLLAEWPEAQGVATDISRAALDVAERNAVGLGVDQRVAFHETNWLEGVSGPYDLVVSNPPYIAANDLAALAPDVRDWEPHVALSPGVDGLSAYRSIASGVCPVLAPNGRVFVECGIDQASSVCKLFEDVGAKNTIIHRDLNGHERVVEASGFR